MTVKAERKFEEFGGVLGCTLISIFTPLMFLVIVFVYQELDSNIYELTWENFSSNVCNSLCDLKAWKFLIAYKVLVALVYMLPATKIVEGPPTPTGEKLKYKISAISSLVIIVAIYVSSLLYDPEEDFIPVSIIKTNYFSLMVVSTVMVYLWQISFYIRSKFLKAEERNVLATSGNAIYDSFMGFELHPRIGQLFDLKIYLYRYSMIAWVMVAVTMCVEVYKNNNSFLSTHPEIFLMCASHAAYCYAVYFGDEESCPHMFDVKHEGLGFSQTFGEIVIVPFIYPLTVHLIISHPDHQHFYTFRVISAVVLLIFGIIVCGVSNHQKTKFRVSDWKKFSADEVIAPVQPSQRALYCGGLWGWSRHPNYLGELLTCFGWSLLCGFSHPLMWWYPFFLVPLLVGRVKRLETTSVEKGNDTWNKYAEKVTYKIIPYVY